MNAELDITAMAPVTGRKVEQVLAGARTVFLRDGFEGASVDDIAREAGVSKATLYSYFSDKRVLFLHVGRIECARQGEVALCEIDADAPVREVLTGAGLRMLDFLCSEFGQRIFRICVAESDRFPALARAFYESGPLVIRGYMCDYFRAAIARGELAIDDLELAADQFHELCKADLLPRLIFQMGPPPEAADKRRAVDAAVEMFLARYGMTA